jgi:L-fuconolactonase
MTSVIDAHQHFLDPRKLAYPWMSAKLAAIDHRYGPEDLAPLLAASDVDGTIVVQAAMSLAETREALAKAAVTPFIVGVVGWVDLTEPTVGETIEELRAGPGGAYLVGIRHPVHDEADPDWLLRGDVRRGLAAVERAGLAFDLLVRRREMANAHSTVQAFPALSFVVDHLGKPPISTGALEPWASDLSAIASPNVVCKLSGLVTEATWGAWEIGELRPYVDRALEVFGPDRLLFGSDWPVCLLSASYETVTRTARSLTAALAETERAAIFGGTARRIYGLG